MLKIAFVFPIICSIAIFKQFNEFNVKLIKLIDRKSGQHNFLLPHFLNNFTHMLLSVFSVNTIFGSQLALVVVLSTPVNTLVIMMLIFGRVPIGNVLSTLGMIFIQLLYLFGVHCLAVHYPIKMYSICKTLFIVNAKLDLKLSFKVKLKLLLKILMLQSRYGITYGAIGAICTAKTFIKVMFHYSSLFSLVMY